ncbi:SDR family oxidoreductase [Nocardia sp. NBC_01377]|uniref:SDR family NAD(P)-dependent oxidoreductase n=1 Tax=Nocardia sp. NBC_01377 TaxID=2903595 RepID=UPI00324E5D34
MITGTGSGQGREAALRFATEGALVHGCDLDAEAAAATVDLVAATGATMRSSRPLDLTDDAAVREWIDGIGAAHGRIDVLYANAGLATFAPIPDITPGDWRYIRANCISPGMIRTSQSEATLLAADHPMREIASAIPLGRLGIPADVVNCAVFLASDEAGYITGANLVVDGGWSAVLPSC